MNAIRHTSPHIAFALLAAALSGCPGQDAAVHETDRFPALGTLVEVSVHTLPRDRADAAFRDVRAAFADVEHELDAWGAGHLGRYNAVLARGETPEPTGELAAAFERAAELERTSGGLFNPMVGWLVERWGFHRPPGPGNAPPPDADLARWLVLAPTLAGHAELARTLDPQRRTLLRVDLGAFAKGTAVAAARDRLRADGVVHALINAGGDIVALGDAGGRPWRIGIRDPRGPGVLAGVALHDGEALFTSGDYERAFEHDGARYHHVLDPRTARPARGTASMTVLHADPESADAAATALFVAGPDWPATAAAMGIRHAMRVDADGRVEILAPFAVRVHFERDDLDVRTIDVPSR